MRQHASASRCTIFVPTAKVARARPPLDAAPCHHVPRDREVGRPSQQAPSVRAVRSTQTSLTAAASCSQSSVAWNGSDPRTPAPAGNSFAGPHDPCD